MPINERVAQLLLGAMGNRDRRDELVAAIEEAESVGTADIEDASVTDPKLRDSAGLSVVGRGANTTGAVADITAASDAHVLRRSGTTLAFGTVAAAGLASDSVTTVKILNSNVTDAKLRDSAGLSIIGRSANSTGVVADITAASDAHVLRRSGTAVGFGTLAAGAYGAGTVDSAALNQNVLRYTDVTIPTASVLTLNATPVTLVAAPGAGFVTLVDSIYATIDYNSAAYVVDAAGLTVRYTDGIGASVGATLTQAFAQASADARRSVLASTTSLTPVANAAIVLYADNADPTTGDSDIKVRVYYRIVPDFL